VTVRLIPAEMHLMDAAIEGDDSLAQALGHAVVPGWVTFTESLPRVRDALAANPGGAEWGTRFFVEGDPPALVGWGGFKGPPADGVVEVGYEVAESRRGQGLATAATEAMVAEAFRDEGISAVIAHTLPEHNASVRVLEKAGFAHDGEAEERGKPVWRHRRDRPTGA
jgi:RimJ/RimL family protein N-acetyltransferase